MDASQKARSRARSRSPSPSHKRSPHKDTHHHHHPPRSESSRSSKVEYVFNKLGKGEYKDFIDYYVRQYDSLLKSLQGAKTFFFHFIHTCRMCLLSTNRYYTHFIEKNGDKEYYRCKPVMMYGPTKRYSELLVYIVKNAGTYDKATAEKIHRLLFWFEEESITFLIVIPYDEELAEIFKNYHIIPGYREQEDGTMTYCSFTGGLFRDGMEISNTRVNALLNEIHSLGDNEHSHEGGEKQGERSNSRGRAGGRGISKRKGTRCNVKSMRRRRTARIRH